MYFQAVERKDVIAVQWTGRNAREVRKALGITESWYGELHRTPVGHWAFVETFGKDPKTLPPESFRLLYRPKAVQTATPPTARYGETVPPDALAAMVDVAKIIGVVNSRVYELAKRSDFPAPFTVVGNRRLWWRADIETWHAKRQIDLGRVARP